eukprot:12859837-Alexandrium_andersonii.AAC.1
MFAGADGCVHEDELRDRDLLQVGARRAAPAGVRAFRFATVAPVCPAQGPRRGRRRPSDAQDPEDDDLDERDWLDWRRDFGGGEDHGEGARDAAEQEEGPEDSARAEAVATAWAALRTDTEGWQAALASGVEEAWAACQPS